MGEHTRVSRSLREREQGDLIKRISIPESNSGEIQESGINPEKTQLNSISSFGSRSKQISVNRKPLFLDTTLCLKEPSQETMVMQGQESCLHTPVWGVEGFNISTSKVIHRVFPSLRSLLLSCISIFFSMRWLKLQLQEVEEELTTGKQLTRVFNGRPRG